MKKTLSLIAVIGSLLATSAYAKTEGNYAGIDILNTSEKHKYKSDFTSPKFGDSSIGVGVNYKHAFNFNQVFLAPGVFFDQLGIKSKDSDLVGKVSESYRYGAKLDLGYDITDDFAVYFTNGLSNLHYSVDINSGVDDETGIVFGGKKSGSKLGYFYGGGLSYKIAKNLVVNLEYNIQSVDLKTHYTTDANLKVASSIKVAKVGLSYNF